MHKLFKAGDPIGRCCVGVAIVAFGIQHLAQFDFVTRLVPKLPAWIPGHSILACGFGAGLIVAGLAVMVRTTARATALLLGATLLSSFLFLYLPLAAAEPSNVGLWVNAGKALAISGSALLIAATLPRKPGGFDSTFWAVLDPLEKLIPCGTYFLGAFFAYCGVLHFIYVDSVANLVPAWIPGPVFWTYFAGLALLAGGVGMNVPSTARLAAGLSSLMIFLWVVLLHIPRALADLRNSNETTAVFEALALAGAALLATSGRGRRSREKLAESRPIFSSASSLRSCDSRTV